MAIKYYLLETDDAPGTGAETDQRDLPRDSTTKALIFDAIAQVNGTSAGTRLTQTAQLDQLRIGAVESNRVGEIDGEDLDAFNVLNGNCTFLDTAAANNSRLSWGMVWPLDPFCIGPNQDLSQNFGIPGTVARKVEFVYAADVITDAGLAIDTKRLAIGILTSSANSNGYLTFARNAFTGATGGTNTFTDIPQPGKLLGVLNFETTGAADITADTEGRTTQSIRQQAITIGRKDVLGPLYTTTGAYMNGNYETGAISDEGYTFWNLGIRNEVGPLGVPTNGLIPTDMEVRTSTGAADAIRVYPVVLNTNLT